MWGTSLSCAFCFPSPVIMRRRVRASAKHPPTNDSRIKQITKKAPQAVRALLARRRLMTDASASVAAAKAELEAEDAAPASSPDGAPAAVHCDAARHLVHGALAADAPSPRLLCGASADAVRVLEEHRHHRGAQRPAEYALRPPAHILFETRAPSAAPPDLARGPAPRIWLPDLALV